MKKLFVVILFFVSSQVFAANCPNFTGTYFRKDGKKITRYIYDQKDCVWLSVVTRHADGQLTEAFIIKADGALAKKAEATDGTFYYGSYAFTETQLVTVWIMDNPKYKLRSTSTSFLHFNDKGDLQIDTVVTDQQGREMGKYSEILQRESF